MAREKKQSKGPKDRNSNFQMKNGNAVSKKKEKKQSSARQAQASSSPASGEKKSFIAGLSSSISSATSSISKMLKH